MKTACLAVKIINIEILNRIINVKIVISNVRNAGQNKYFITIY